MNNFQELHQQQKNRFAIPLQKKSFPFETFMFSVSSLPQIQ
jgi:hypothetical protein